MNQPEFRWSSNHNGTLLNVQGFYHRNQKMESATQFLHVSYIRMRLCVPVYITLVHDVVQKDMFCREHIFFWMIRHFSNGLFVVHFWSVCPSSVDLAIVHRPPDTFHMELVHAFCALLCVLSYASQFPRLHARSYIQLCARSYARSFWQVQGSDP